MKQPNVLLVLPLSTMMLSAVLNAVRPSFPPVGVGPGQWLRLHVIALGTNDGRCQAMLGFRDATATPIGPSLNVDLTIGQSASVDYPSSATRTEIVPSVEPISNPSACFSAVELIGASGARAYLASSIDPPVRPVDDRRPTLVDTGSGESLRVVVHRMEEGVCRLILRLRDDHRVELAAKAPIDPEPGHVSFTDWITAGQPVRIAIELNPASEHSGVGCRVAAELIDAATGQTTRHVPVSIPDLIITRSPNETRYARSASSIPIGIPVVIPVPLGLAPVLFPDDNPPTVETIALGRRLFYDRDLSRDGTTSCASCHDPAADFRDPRRVSQGVNGAQGLRHSMSIFNAGYVRQPFWDGRAASLEDQVIGPVQNPLELAFSDQGIEQRLSFSPIYIAKFAAAFGPGPITFEKVAKCLAAFERTILSGNSPFDRFFYGGDITAMSVEAQRGFVQFTGREQCTQCHILDGASNLFANTGIAAISFTELSDQGRWSVTGNEGDRGAFRAVSLRNVALHAPYMHDGSLPTLEDVLAYYFRGGNQNRWLSHLMPPIRPAGSVSPQDISDLIAFLNSLTGEMPPNLGPPGRIE